MRQGASVWVVTADRDRYWRVRARPEGSGAGPDAAGWEEIRYGARFRAAEEWPILRSGARAEAICRRIGYPEEELFLYRPLADPAWWARVLYVGRRERIESYQAEFPGFVLPAWIASRLLGGRAVLSAHNVEFDRLRRMKPPAEGGISEARLGRIRRVEVAMMRAADAVMALSGPDRGRMTEAGVPPGAIHLIPHGVPLADFQGQRADLRRRYGLTGPILFFHGTLHYAPNTEAVRFLLTALFPLLRPPASLLIAGMPPPPEVLALAAGPDAPPEMAGRVRFCGPVDDLAAHIQAADLCLCPIEAGGGTRMKLMEYFAAGKAVVSTPFGAEGLPVQHDRDIVFAPLDGFAAEIDALLLDPARRLRIGRAARALASAYDWSAVGAAILGVHRGEGRDFTPRPGREAHLPRRRPSKPLTLLLLLNRGCNLRCSFCDLWEGFSHMPLERVRPLLQQAVDIGTRVLVLTGGEPLLHPDLPEIVEEARRLGLSVNITTNGTLLERSRPRRSGQDGDGPQTHLRHLLRAGVHSLSFSIDGLPATHDSLRGQPGAHARTWAAIRRTLDEGRAQGVGVSVYFVVTARNVRELVPVWEQVRALGGGASRVGFDFWPVNLDPQMKITGKPEELLLLRPEDQQAWREAVAHIAAHDPEIAARRAYYEEALGYHEGASGPVRCLGLIDQYGVTYAGDLLPCCVWGGDGLKVGNVFERPLTDLWDSPAVQQHRERMYRDGCTAGCYNHSLYEFGISTGESHRVKKQGE